MIKIQFIDINAVDLYYKMLNIINLLNWVNI